MFEDFLFRTYIDRVIVWNKNIAELQLEITWNNFNLKEQISAMMKLRYSSSDEEDEVEEDGEVVVQLNVRQRKPSTMNGSIKKGKYQ